MRLTEMMTSQTQIDLLANAIEAAQDLIDGRYFTASEVAKDTGLPVDRCEQIVKALQVLRAIDPTR
jgi:diacylglycerol kinase